MIARFFESIRFYFRLHGFIGGLLFGLGLICSDTEYIYVSDLQKLDPEIQKYRNPQMHTVFVKTLEEFRSVAQDYEKIRGKMINFSDIPALKSGRDYLAVVYQGNVFVGWGWIKAGPLVYGSCPVGSTDCLIHKCRTIREHRGKGVYTAALIDMQTKMAELGFSKAVIGAKSFNKSSIRGIEKAGFGLVERYKVGSFWSRFFSHVKGKGPKILRI